MCRACAREALASEEIDHIDPCEWAVHAAILQGVVDVALKAWAGDPAPVIAPRPGVGRTPTVRGAILAVNLERMATDYLGAAVALIVTALAGSQSKLARSS